MALIVFATEWVKIIVTSYFGLQLCNVKFHLYVLFCFVFFLCTEHCLYLVLLVSHTPFYK